MSDYGLMTSPLGEILLRAEDNSLTGVFFVGQRYFPSAARPPFAPAATGAPVIRAACRQLEAFLRGRQRLFDLPLRLHGSAFQQRVWRELTAIPFGGVTSYGAIARGLGLGTGHARAVGAAIGRNPISIIVPCHRVLSGNGGLAGYAGGLDRKRRLLALEQVAPAALVAQPVLPG